MPKYEMSVPLKGADINTLKEMFDKEKYEISYDGAVFHCRLLNKESKRCLRWQWKSRVKRKLKRLVKRKIMLEQPKPPPVGKPIRKVRRRSKMLHTYLRTYIHL
ncbi:uncharacterized protein LOC114515829 [Dendronephthya gigantea]|uniref:uncharacterized protein LOC114515829 n=1 Tax=Dendronephthya gigantea TaxID=151771 RepID=UPI00106A20B2|nr:uncharacterized protein LOC114515829 [Dendronephthya gigantea]